MAALPTVLFAHPSADVYGSDLQLLESIEALMDAGWRSVLCLPTRGPLTDSLPTRVALIPTPVLRKALLRPVPLVKLPLRAPVDLVRAVRQVRSVRPDVVYVNTLTIPLWILAGWLCRVPILVHVHEAEVDLPRILRVGLNAPLLLARRIVANSRAAAEIAVATVPRLVGRTEVILNGVPDRGAAAPEDAEPGRLALVARLSPRKGVDVALEAVALLRRQGHDVRLDVCGTTFPGYEWYEAELRERAQRPDLAGAITFAGYVNPTLPVLSRASIVLVPSRVEPFGNTAVEAMFAQRPLVASAVQGLAEIVTDGETGRLVPPGDATALATAIAELLGDPEAARGMAQRARSVALRRFAVRRYREDVVRAVLATARSRGEEASAAC